MFNGEILCFYEQLIYEKLPKDISERHVLLLDPVLATGAVLLSALEDLKFLRLFSLFRVLLDLPYWISCFSRLWARLLEILEEVLI